MGKQRKNTDKIKEQSKGKKTTSKQNIVKININNNTYYNNDNNELSDFDIALKKIIEYKNR